MQINFNDFDLENFLVREDNFCGIPAKLIQPNHIGTKFNQNNKIFRSSIWDLNGNLLSASYPKFVNFGENPENFPVPSNINGCHILTKLDGSCVIVDYVNGQLSARTRGTFSYKTLNNFYDYEQAIQQIPAIESWLKNNSQYSLLFEITTPNNKIVINYGNEVKLWLTGCVDKTNYSLMTQTQLDSLGVELGVSRPETYTFDSIQDLLVSVDKWEGKEGVCIYSKDGQEIHKVKAAKYLLLHYMKSEMSSIEKVMDVWLSQNRPSYNDFYNYIATTFDFEIAETARGFISQICDGWKEVEKIEAGMKKFLSEQVLNLPTRKLQAVVITQSYGNTNRSSFLFKLLDGKSLEKEDYKKLLFQVLKNS